MKTKFDELESMMDFISKNWQILSEDNFKDIVDHSYNLGYTEGEDVSYKKADSNSTSSDDDIQNSYDEGFEDGQNSRNENSYEEGRETGYQNGYEEGRETGYQNGYEEGQSEGYDEGKVEGYDEGYEARGNEE